MPAVNTTYTFQDSDVITSAKMNNIIDQTTFVDSGISGTTLEVTTSGQLKVRSQNITSNELASNAVTTTKITDKSVTPAKLSTGAPSWDAAGAVLLGASGETASLTRATGVDGAFTISNSGPIVFNDVPLGIQEGTAPIYGARAFAKVNPEVNNNKKEAYKYGSYTRSPIETTVTIAGHGLKPNDKIFLSFTSGGGTDNPYVVTSAPTGNQFIVDHTGTATSGLVEAQFVQIQSAKNISSVSRYTNDGNRFIFNFEIPMENDEYSTSATSQYYPGAWVDIAGEDTLGQTQLNTRYQAHIGTNNSPRFLSVIVYS